MILSIPFRIRVNNYPFGNKVALAWNQIIKKNKFHISDSINRNKRSDVTTFIKMAATLPAGNLLILILTYPINRFCDSFLILTYPINRFCDSFLILTYPINRFCDSFRLLSNTTVATSGTGIAYPFRAPEFTPGFQWGFVLLDL